MTALDLLHEIEAALPRLRQLAGDDGEFLLDHYGDDLERAGELLAGVVEAFVEDDDPDGNE